MKKVLVFVYDLVTGELKKLFFFFFLLLPLSSSFFLLSQTMEQPITIRLSAQDHLSGILRTSTSSASPKRIILICHGVFGHKDYLFQPQLAQSLDFFGSSFRFDFRGNGDSSGELKYAKYQEDWEDLEAVVSYWRNLGYSVEGLIGHSRGFPFILPPSSFILSILLPSFFFVFHHLLFFLFLLNKVDWTA